LQPFSRRYFEPCTDGDPGRLFTYAVEWRTAHEARVQDAGAPGGAATPATGKTRGDPHIRQLTVQSVAAFLRNPVKEFFRHRLQVSFDEAAVVDEDDECFTTLGLERWVLLDEVLRVCRGWADAPRMAPLPGQLPGFLEQQVARLQRSGRLPLAGPGRRVQAELLQTLWPVVAAWQDVLTALPLVRDKEPLRLVHPQDDRLVFDDWLVGLRGSQAQGPSVWIELQAGKVADAGTQKAGPIPRAGKLLAAWVRCLASASCGCPAEGIVIGEGASVRVSPPAQAEATATLTALMQACRDGLDGDLPLPTVVKTGTAWLAKPDAARQAYDGKFRSPVPGEGQEACLARLFPDFASLVAHPGFDAASRRLYGPFSHWLAHHVTVTMRGTSGSQQGACDE
jgi:exodeoxyribonuclease V gamma subunit